MRFILDASAILAWLKRETAWERVTEAMDGSFAVGAANYAEVVGKLVDEKVPEADIALMLEEFTAELVPVDRQIASIAGHLRRSTRERGLSLGDRLCLATALAEVQARRAPVTVVTADRSWAALRLEGVAIMAIR